MLRRNTIQREVVLRAVKSLHNHPSADEVYAYVTKECPNIGRGTVYRNLNILAEDGELRKAQATDGPDRFDHNLMDHYHVTCVHCGKMYDVDMEVISDVEERIHDKHGIKYLGYDILFKGVCPACQKEHEDKKEEAING